MIKLKKLQECSNFSSKPGMVKRDSLIIDLVNGFYPASLDNELRVFAPHGGTLVSAVNLNFIRLYSHPKNIAIP